MYKIGQKVMYLSKKMMVISAIEDKSFQENCIKKYYLLKSEKDDNNVIYLPVDSDIANKNIRPLLTKKEINKCIDSFNDIDSVYESSYKDRVLKYNELPACLVECGFMSSAPEREKLFDPEYQKKIAEGIANGIEKFLPLE